MQNVIPSVAKVAHLVIIGKAFWLGQLGGCSLGMAATSVEQIDEDCKMVGI